MSKRSRRSRTGVLPGAGRLRCHCGSPAVLRSAEGLCRTHRPGAMAYVCSRYPVCDSYVMAHPGTLEPMGSLAGPKLRQLRYAAHREFNKLYQSGLMSKRDAYQWLAMTVQAPMAHAHIGHLGEYYCQVVIDESRKLLQERLEQQNKLKEVAGGVCHALLHGQFTRAVVLQSAAL